MMSYNKRAARRGAPPAFGLPTIARAPLPDPLSEEAFAELKELLKDAEACARLSKWEEDFLSSMRDRVLQYEADTRVSDAQQASLNRIREKVYA